MLSSFRRLSKSKIGAAISVLFLVGILAGFALSDMKSIGANGFGMGSGTIAKVGGQEVTERDLSDMFARVLQQQRQENPNLTAADLAPQFDRIVDELINQRALGAFAADSGLPFSNALVGAEIAKIPAARGLDGKFSEAAYAQFLQSQRLTDAMVRRMLMGELGTRTILLPAAALARPSTKVATVYASLLLEERRGQMATILIDPFKAGLVPSAGDLQAYYDQNKSRYMQPERRSLQLVPVVADQVKFAAPSDAEIAAYYKKNAATYAGSEKRVISQIVAQDQKAAAAVAAKARASSMVEAAKITGQSAADISVGPKTRTEYAAISGGAMADQLFKSAKGSVVGPVKTDLGWLVAKVDDVQVIAGKSLAQARGEIVTALTAEKKQAAVENLIADIQDKIDDGSSLGEIAKAEGLAMSETPLVTANGKQVGNDGYAFPPAYAKALKSGFELAEGDDPVIEELAGDQKGYVLVGAGRIVAASPRPLAEIGEQVKTDWIHKKASDLARAEAAAIAAKVAKGMALADAIKGAKGVNGVMPISARRLQLSQVQGPAAAPLRMLFSLGEGKSRMTAGPGGRAYFVVKNEKVTPGNAALQPALIGQVQESFAQSGSQELAQQFLGAIREDLGVNRNEEAIRAAKARLTATAE